MYYSFSPRNLEIKLKVALEMYLQIFELTFTTVTTLIAKTNENSYADRRELFHIYFLGLGGFPFLFISPPG